MAEKHSREIFGTKIIVFKFIRLFTILLGIALACASCSDLPRDPKNTLRRIENEKKMRVGLVENPPWVIRSANGEPAGAEVELIKNLAAQMDAQAEWHWGNEQQQFEALERFELDLVVGGFHDKTPWSKQIGLTSPYFENRILLGFPASVASTDEIKGMRIATKNGEATAAFIEKKDAVPVRVDEFSAAGQMPVAAPEWELEKLGLRTTKTELNKEKHIMAVPPGENGWIKRLDEFLSSQRSQVKSLLQQNSEEARK
jgi:polar amino acid transport system substrate-binding protein